MKARKSHRALTDDGGERPARVGGRVKVHERATGPFKRTFSVPFAVDPQAIRAHLHHGVLTLTLPRQGEGAGPRDIEVEVEGG